MLLIKEFKEYRFIRRIIKDAKERGWWKEDDE